MRTFVTLALCGLALCLGGCRTGGTSASHSMGDIEERLKETNAALANVSIETAASRYRNTTVKSYDLSHGTQVEYRSADGRCYLWYPGNANILRCRWKIEKRLGRHPRPGYKPVPHICYSYGQNTYNPATGHRGSGWQCESALARFTDQNGTVSFIIPPRLKPETLDVVTGDKFNLAGRMAVPFVLKKKPYTFTQLDAGLRSQ